MALHTPPSPPAPCPQTPALAQMVTAGFPAVTDALKRGVDIRYNVTVTGVEQDGAGVTVTAADGTEYRGRYAVVTPGLGSLKAGNISFVPALPAAKLAAIRDMVSCGGAGLQGVGGTQQEALLAGPAARQPSLIAPIHRPSLSARALACWTRRFSCLTRCAGRAGATLSGLLPLPCRGSVAGRRPARPPTMPPLRCPRLPCATCLACAPPPQPFWPNSDFLLSETDLSGRW